MAQTSGEMTARAMGLLLEKLLVLRIQGDEVIEIHMGAVTHMNDTDYLADFVVIDVNERVHDGHVEVVNGEVAVATLDGVSILPSFFQKARY